MKLGMTKAAFLLGATMTLGALGVCWLPEPYHRWMEARLVRGAEGFLEAGDARRAMLMAKSALERDPESVGGREALKEAYRRMGDRRLLDLLDSGPETALERVMKALELKDLVAARQAFQRLSPVRDVELERYHEMGCQVYRNDSEMLYHHVWQLSGLRPTDPEPALQAAYLALILERPLTPLGADRLLHWLHHGSDAERADAAALAFAFSLSQPVQGLQETFPSALQLGVILEDRVQSATSLRPLFLRAFELSAVRDQWAADRLMRQLFDLCEKLEVTQATREMAETLTRLGRRESLVDWFLFHGKAFPEPEDIHGAFARLLVGDAASRIGDWQAADKAFDAGSPEGWGELFFLREFYADWLARQRQNVGELTILRGALATGPSAEELDLLASSPWQQAVLDRLRQTVGR